MPAFLRKYFFRISVLVISMPFIFQACCPSDGCDEFCSGFQLKLSFEQDSTKAEYFPKRIMDSMFVIRTLPGHTTDTQHIGSNVVYIFNTPQDPAGARFIFFSTADTTLNLQLDSIQSIVQPEKCCECGELAATEFNLQGQRHRVSRGGTFLITP